MRKRLLISILLCVAMLAGCSSNIFEDSEAPINDVIVPSDVPTSSPSDEPMLIAITEAQFPELELYKLGAYQAGREVFGIDLCFKGNDLFALVAFNEGECDEAAQLWQISDTGNKLMYEVYFSDVPSHATVYFNNDIQNTSVLCMVFESQNEQQFHLIDITNGEAQIVTSAKVGSTFFSPLLKSMVYSAPSVNYASSLYVVDFETEISRLLAENEVPIALSPDGGYILSRTHPTYGEPGCCVMVRDLNGNLLFTDTLPDDDGELEAGFAVWFDDMVCYQAYRAPGGGYCSVRYLDLQTWELEVVEHNKGYGSIDPTGSYLLLENFQDIALYDIRNDKDAVTKTECYPQDLCVSASGDKWAFSSVNETGDRLLIYYARIINN